MDADLAMTMGVIIGAFSIPAILSAISDGRAPRVPMVIILIAGSLILYATYTKPGGYAISDVPDAMLNTVAKIIP